MLNLPDLSPRPNLDANRVLFEVQRNDTLCLAQIATLLNLNRSYVANLCNHLENARILTRISVPSPFPEDFCYFYDPKQTPLLQVETRIRSEQRIWKGIFPKYASAVHDALLRHVYQIMRRLGFAGIGKGSLGEAGVKDKSLLSQIRQGRADFDIVLSSKFQKCRLIIEIKNRNTVPATEDEVRRFGERTKHFPGYGAVFISRAFTGPALAMCNVYGIKPINIRVQPLTIRLLSKLMKIPHYAVRTINGNPLNPSVDTFYGRKIVQFRLEDFLCDIAPEPSVESWIRRFGDKWRIMYPRFVKFQAKLSLFGV